MSRIEIQISPDRYRHWRIETDGEIASLIMDVDPAGGLSTDYELKLNSYDLAVDIELNDAIQRLRFEHPEVRAVVVKSGTSGRTKDAPPHSLIVGIPATFKPLSHATADAARGVHDWHI